MLGLLSNLYALFILLALLTTHRGLTIASSRAQRLCLELDDGDAVRGDCRPPVVVAVVPIRSGSKSVVDKNIRMIGGKPLVAHSIGHALSSRWISRVVVSTDSERYRAVAQAHGAEAPFLRPRALSTDYVADLPVFQHVLRWLSDAANTGGSRAPDVVVHLRATCPVRRVADIDAAIHALLSAGANATAVRSVVQVSDPGPWRMWTAGPVRERDDARAVANFATRTRGPGTVLSLEPLAGLPGYGVGEAGNSPRQLLPPVFVQDSCIEVAWATTIRQGKSMTGDKVLGYVTSKSVDIDTEEDFQAAQRAIQQQEQEQRQQQGGGNGQARGGKDGGRAATVHVAGVEDQEETETHHHVFVDAMGRQEDEQGEQLVAAAPAALAAPAVDAIGSSTSRIPARRTSRHQEDDLRIHGEQQLAAAAVAKTKMMAVATTAALEMLREQVLSLGGTPVA